MVNPGSGDAVQAMKAGLLEVADLFVVNKADRPGVKELERDLHLMLDLDPHMGEWRPPILRTVASTGEGAAELWAAVGEHRAFLEAKGLLAERRARRVADELGEIVARRLERRAFELCAGPAYERLHEAVVDRRLDPWSAAEEIVGTVAG